MDTIQGMEAHPPQENRVADHGGPEIKESESVTERANKVNPMREAVTIIRLKLACEIAIILLDGEHEIRPDDRKALVQRMRELMKAP